MDAAAFEEHRRQGYTDYFAGSTSGISVRVTCSRCGAPVELVAKGRRYAWQTAAVVKCSRSYCTWTGVVNVTICSTAADTRGAEFRIREAMQTKQMATA